MVKAHNLKSLTSSECQYKLSSETSWKLWATREKCCWPHSASYHTPLLFYHCLFSYLLCSFSLLPNFSNHHLKSLVSHLTSCFLQVHEAMSPTEYQLEPPLIFMYLLLYFAQCNTTENKHGTRARALHFRNPITRERLPTIQYKI